MIGFEKINHYKILFLVLLWLGYGTGCISTPPEMPSQTEHENPPESPSQTSSESSSESASQSSSKISSEDQSQTSSEDSSESLSQSPTLTSPETSSEKSSESISQSSLKSPSGASSEVTSQNQPQTASEGSTESTPQSALQELESRLEVARKDLRISETTEARIASGLEQLKNSGNPSPETLEDYETYLSRAQEMVAENQKTVQELEALHARYATAASRPSASTDARKVSNPKLPDEKEYDELGKLDRKLDQSLAAFDELLLRELDEIQDKSAEKMRDLAAEAAAAAQRLGEQGISVDPSSTEAASGSQESARESEQSEGSPEKGEEGGIQSETAGNRQKGSKGAVGGQGSVQEHRTRPSGHDDDIVARQIREAAEKETDPELKEKLWKEYEDYKKGSRY